MRLTLNVHLRIKNKTRYGYAKCCSQSVRKYPCKIRAFSNRTAVPQIISECAAWISPLEMNVVHSRNIGPGLNRQLKGLIVLELQRHQSRTGKENNEDVKFLECSRLRRKQVKWTLVKKRGLRWKSYRYDTQTVLFPLLLQYHLCWFKLWWFRLWLTCISAKILDPRFVHYPLRWLPWYFHCFSDKQSKYNKFNLMAWRKLQPHCV